MTRCFAPNGSRKGKRGCSWVLPAKSGVHNARGILESYLITSPRSISFFPSTFLFGIKFHNLRFLGFEFLDVRITTPQRTSSTFPTMPFTLVHKAKHRTQSVQLNQASLAAAKIDLGSPRTQQPQAKRIASLPAASQRSSSSPPVAPLSNASPPYRSMIDMDDPPKLEPCTTMSSEELNSGSTESTKFDSDGGNSDITEVASPIFTLKHQGSTITCQEPPIANAHACSRIFSLLCSFFMHLWTNILCSYQRQCLPALNGAGFPR